MAKVTQVQNGDKGLIARTAWNYALQSVAFTEMESSSWINDDTMATASATTFATSVSIKNYVDSSIGGVSVTLLTSASSPYTITGAEQMISVDASGGSVLINFPTAVGYSGFPYIHRTDQTGGNTVTLAADGVETIDGVASITLNAGIAPSSGEAVRVYSDGSNLQYV